MKTLFNSLLVAFTLTVVTCSASWAESNKPIGRPKNVAAFQSGMYTTAEGKLRIALDKQTGGSVVIRLTNQAGTDLFVEQVGQRQQTARLLLDISALPDGLYQVVITNGVETTKQALTLATTRQTIAVSRLVAFN
ncbi:hypothetical protein GCM10028803_36600 [Larkinella knui]|uniref:T9SS C-terminal target domain-containing protein n=1 Tax=Larkinella knui TaxID=2025310 RepID=A0A3P1CE41_9BACT|nr:hypothetical protein [Larkinella knui]RRB11518.1 hypothetical protein EHT87_23880 [Larkinella knui]